MIRSFAAFSVGGASLQFFDAEDQFICRTELVLLCLGRKYAFVGPDGELLFMIQMKSTLNKTSLLVNGKEVGLLTARWVGPYSGFFYERFKYAISISHDVPKTNLLRNILFGLGLAYYRAMG